MLNPNQFADFVEATKSGGATLDVQTGSLIGNDPKGPHGYIVGGEPNASGNRIETQRIPQSEFNQKTAHKAAQSIVSSADNSPGLGVGGWFDTEQDSPPVEIDAVRVHPTLKGAMGLAQQRGERAVWSTKLQQEIRTKEYFKNPQKFHDMVGEPL